MCYSSQERERRKVSHWQTSVHKTLCINSFFVETDPVSVRDALIKLLVDVDHSVRLHLARDITVLFPSTNTPLEHMNNFKDVEKLLHQATLVKVSELRESLSFFVSSLSLCFFSLSSFLFIIIIFLPLVWS